MANKNTNLLIIPLFKKYISETETGKRLQKNGKMVAKSTIENYKALLYNLIKFQEASQQEIIINIDFRNTKRNFTKEKNYYSRLYKQFTDFLYAKNCKDNYVGMMIKMLRSFFIYLNQVKGYQTGTFYKDFYSRKEDLPIVVISHEQLQFLIRDNTFEESLPLHLQTVKDTFVFGCTIGLRYSDLTDLTWRNVQVIKGNTYIVTKSKKTSTDTRIKLPDYAIKILNKCRKNKKYIFKPLSLNQFNKNSRSIVEIAGWDFEVGKVRSRRGKNIELKKKDKAFRFCDLISSHTMRKTSITTLLILGMPEPLVRKISGHASNSKEFYKYVKYSESFMDNETDKAFAKLVE